MDNLCNKPFLRLEHLEKVYPNGEKAVYDFNLDVKKHEFIVIVGPSGCGKSTTLRMLAGLEDITSGDIFMEDELLNYKESKDRNMAIVFQSYALYPQMTVFDNIAFPLRINKYPTLKREEELYALSEVLRVLENESFSAVKEVISETVSDKSPEAKKIEETASYLKISLPAAKKLLTLVKNADGSVSDEQVRLNLTKTLSEELKTKTEEAIASGKKFNEEYVLLNDKGEEIKENKKLAPYEIKNKVYDVAEKLDLVPYLDKIPKELSGGQMQRVALGRAIIKNVPVFMMDEPLSNLDAKLRLTMRSEIVKLHNRIGATTIYVTHDQTEAMTMATRIVVMSRGFIQQIGSPEEVYSHPVNIFVAKFIGSPAMNIFESTVTADGEKITFGRNELKMGEDFKKLHDDFYKKKIEEFEDLYNNFDETAREKLFRILSATGEGKRDKGKKKAKKGVILSVKNFFKRLFKKEEVKVNDFSAEKAIVAEKLELLKKYQCSSHPVTVGIRPERMKIFKTSEVDKKGVVTAKPAVCELLGGEYNVHFDFLGKDMVGRYDAKNKISVEDEITVFFDPDGIHVFDPVTGDTIK